MGPLSTISFSWFDQHISRRVMAFSKLRTVLKANRRPDDDERHLRSTSRICVQIHLCWWEGSFECLPSRPNFAREIRVCNHAACSAPDPETEAETKPSPTPVPRRASPETFFRRQGGVGKTTTSSSLAIQLSYTRKVCIHAFVVTRQTFYALSRIGSAAVDGPCAQPQRCIPAAVR